MSDISGREQSFARALLNAVQTKDTLSCAEAEELLPELIAAEQAGAAVDDDPRFAALLVHLDHCSECLELYGQISEDMDELLDPDAEVVPITTPPPRFFEPPAPRTNTLVRVLEGIKNGFQLFLPPPRFEPAVATLSRTETLLSATLTDVPGSPLVVVSVAGSEESPEVQVVVQRLEDDQRWRIELRFGGQTYSTETDDTGIAQFADLSVEALKQAHELELRCTEL
jgi:hypothetical protein